MDCLMESHMGNALVLTGGLAGAISHALSGARSRSSVEQTYFGDRVPTTPSRVAACARQACGGKTHYSYLRLKIENRGDTFARGNGSLRHPHCLSRSRLGRKVL